MKLSKALESGRPFRMKGETNFYTRFEGQVIGEGGATRGVSAADLDSNDWETEPKEVKVTKSALQDALSGVVNTGTANTILQRLGLEE